MHSAGHCWLWQGESKQAPSAGREGTITGSWEGFYKSSRRRQCSPIWNAGLRAGPSNPSPSWAPGTAAPFKRLLWGVSLAKGNFDSQVSRCSSYNKAFGALLNTTVLLGSPFRASARCLAGWALLINTWLMSCHRIPSAQNQREPWAVLGAWAVSQRKDLSAVWQFLLLHQWLDGQSRTTQTGWFYFWGRTLSSGDLVPQFPWCCLGVVLPTMRLTTA